MAEAALSFVLRKLADVALNEALKLYNVSDQVKPMHAQLRLIQSFLKDAKSKRNQDERVKQWVKEVRDVTHRIEDVIDTFLVEIEENSSRSSGIISTLKRVVKHPKRLAWFCKEIEEIQKTLDTIHEQITQLDIKEISGGSEERSVVPSQPDLGGGSEERSVVPSQPDLGGGSEERSVVPSQPDLGGGSEEKSVVPSQPDLGGGSEERSVVPFRPSELHQIDGSEVVGFAADKKKIIDHLLDRSISRRTVLSIVGIGGIGKTTLAKLVYESAEVKEQFNYRIWLSISQKFNLTNLLREILYSVDPQMKITGPNMTDEDLSVELKKSLSGKRYLITLDDVWITDLWNQLKIILPDTKNESRVLITCRSLEVAKAADPETSPHKLSCLTEEESVILLLRKAFPHKQPNNYPPDILEVAKQLAKNCGGLPMTLTVLGGILSTRDPTYSAWHMMEQTMDWHNEKENKCSQVLAMSYDDLPYHLKPCFLYFAFFPEDCKISAKHVTKMWIAEGFITKDGVRTLEDNAHNYLQELVQRCLIQVIEKSWNGYCKYFVVHDLLHDLAIHEAKEENFFTIFSKAEENMQVAVKKARRASVQFYIPIEYGFHSTNTRSLLFWGECISNYQEFKLLRVLTIEHVDMRRKKAASEMWLKGLVHLRYMGFRYCEELPGFGLISFRSLNLQTLEFKKTRIFEAPNDSLWNIPTMRHMIFPFSSPIICNQSKWNHLENLQTLKWVTFQNFPELRHNINLRKMGLRLRTDFWEQGRTVEQARDMLNGLLRRMEFLVSLSIRSIDYAPFPFDGNLPCHKTIQSLCLDGMWPEGITLNDEMFPENLTKFTLIGSRLKEDPMPILEKLKSLKILRLRLYSYVGNKLTCSSEWFPNLEKLELADLPNLDCLEIKERAMPKLSQLKIQRCDKLHKLPDLQNVPTLQDLILDGVSQRKMQSKEENQSKIKRIPSVHIT